MITNRFAWSLSLLLSVSVWGQSARLKPRVPAAASPSAPATAQSSLNTPSPSAPGGVKAGSTAPSKTVAGDPQLQQLLNEMRSPQSSPVDVKQAVESYLSSHKDATSQEVAETLAMEYFQAHGNLPDMLDYGQRVLAHDPDSMAALLGLSAAIALSSNEADLNGPQMLQQASQYAQHALEVLSKIGPDYHGVHLTPEQFSAVQRTVKAQANVALGLIDYKQRHFNQAITHYRLALQSATPAEKATYDLRLALAQEEVRQYGDALSSLESALANPQGSPAVKTMARAERVKIQRLAGLPVSTPRNSIAAPAAPAMAPAATTPTATPTTPSAH